MPITYDPTTDLGKVRLLCQDTNVDEWIFADNEIQAFLDLNNGSIFYAAANGLEVLAASEIYVQKRIKMLDLWTNGPAEAEQLLVMAKSYRDQEDTGGPGEVPFDIAEWVNNQFSYRERVRKQLLRQAL